MSFLKHIFQYAQITLKRSFHDTRPFEPFVKQPVTKRRYGYKSRYHERGLLPRLNDQSIRVRSVIGRSERPDSFHPKLTLFGQNDYIDILGNGSIKPHEMLKEIPWWLRGFKENSELHMLQRMLVAKGESFKWNRPKKWHEIQQRIDFLYKYKNYRREPPEPKPY